MAIPVKNAWALFEEIVMENASCPCGSGRAYDNCCGLYLDGRDHAPTAEALMRSRYTAYALGRAEYLRSTWHPSTCPSVLNLDPGLLWIDLRILRCEAGGPTEDRGTVEFIARWKRGGRAHRLHEISRFTRDRGKWVYLDGSFPVSQDTRTKSGRKER